MMLINKNHYPCSSNIHSTLVPFGFLATTNFFFSFSTVSNDSLKKNFHLVKKCMSNSHLHRNKAEMIPRTLEYKIAKPHLCDDTLLSDYNLLQSTYLSCF